MLLFIKMLPTLPPSHLLWAAASLSIPTAASWIFACRRKKGTMYPVHGLQSLLDSTYGGNYIKYKM